MGICEASQPFLVSFHVGHPGSGLDIHDIAPPEFRRLNVPVKSVKWLIGDYGIKIPINLSETRPGADRSGKEWPGSSRKNRALRRD